MITSLVNKSHAVMKYTTANKYDFKAQTSVLIVDDDYRIRDLLKRFLKKSGYFSILAQNAEMAIHCLETFQFDIVIVDVMMPRIDGFELTEIISNRFKVPVFMLTARTDINDKLNGFKVGADDYLTKPFEPEELLVRIKAITRRSSKGAVEDESQPVNNDEFFLDLEKQILRINGNSIGLTANEIALLNVFNKYRNIVLSRDEIINELNRADYFQASGKKIINDRLIDLQITRLRKKIEPNPTHPVYLKTVRGFGYKLLL